MEPLVTVVICTLNTPQHVLEDLKKQTYKNHEVIIADHEGIVKAMNFALAKANGEIFVRIDDDVKLPERWLEELIKPFNNYNVAGVTGPTFVPHDRRGLRDSIRLAENPNWFLRWMFDGGIYKPAGIYKCGSVSYDSNYEERMPEYYIKNNYHFQCDHLEGTNWAMRTDLIKKVGGFDTRFDGVCEWYDTDVEQKVKNLGYKLIYNPKAHLYHMLEKGDHYTQRFMMLSRIENWLRFHIRHSKFHYKKIIFLTMMIGYSICLKRK